MINKIIKERRSVSTFENKKVGKKIIDELISISGYAPSSCNTQPWFFLVFNTDKSKARLEYYIDKGHEKTQEDLLKDHKILGKTYSKLLKFFAKYGKFDEAPIHILLFSRAYDMPVFSQAIIMSKNKGIQKIVNESVLTSSAMAMQNFLLVSHAKGLATRVKDGIKFLMNFDELKNELYGEFNIPKEYQLVSGIQLGYMKKSSSKKVALARLSLNKIRRYV